MAVQAPRQAADERLAGLRGARHELRLLAVPGQPYAQARDVVYSLPVEESRFELGQGFHGGYSHGDEANRYAIDLIVDEGAPVLAARDGTVVATMAGHAEGGADRSLAGQANFVRVLHEDGSMALYAHLQEGGVSVRAGDRVHLGQVLGYAGSTGFSSGPHLHFAVQVNGGMRLVSVPFRMIGPDGYLPLITSDSLDRSVYAGARGDTAGGIDQRTRHGGRGSDGHRARSPAPRAPARALRRAPRHAPRGSPAPGACRRRPLAAALRR